MHPTVLEKKHQAGQREREVKEVKCQTATAVDSRMPQPLTFNLEEREDSVLLFSRAETQPTAEALMETVANTHHHMKDSVRMHMSQWR